MSLRRVLHWLAITALFYVLFLIVFTAANVATIAAVRGSGVLTDEVLRYLVQRNAVVCIPLTIVGTALFSAMSRRR